MHGESKARLRNGEGALFLSSSEKSPKKANASAPGLADVIFFFREAYFQTGHFCAMVSPRLNSYPIVRAMVSYFRREERTAFNIAGTLSVNDMATFSSRHVPVAFFGSLTWGLVFHVKRPRLTLE
jgi:hypothetical protein